MSARMFIGKTRDASAMLGMTNLRASRRSSHAFSGDRLTLLVDCRMRLALTPRYCHAERSRGISRAASYLRMSVWLSSCTAVAGNGSLLMTDGRAAWLSSIFLSMKPSHSGLEKVKPSLCKNPRNLARSRAVSSCTCSSTFKTE